MLNFYNDRKQTFECKIKLEGTEHSLKNSRVRLVFEDGNVQRFYVGTTDILGNCIVNLPPLKEHTNLTGDVVLEVRINDIVFEPYRNKYDIKEMMKIEEVKIHDKQKLIQEKTNKKDIILIKELLSGFNRVDAKNKKVLIEYITLKYKPSQKIKNWAKHIFRDLNDTKAKVVMYELEMLYNK